MPNNQELLTKQPIHQNKHIQEEPQYEEKTLDQQLLEQIGNLEKDPIFADEEMLENQTMQHQLQEKYGNDIPDASVPTAELKAVKSGKRSVKHRVKNHYRRKSGSKRHAFGDEYTDRLVSKSSEYAQGDRFKEDQVLAKVPTTEVHCDTRVLCSFCRDVKLNKQGKPATPQDQANLLYNRKMVADYRTGDPEIREPYITGVVDHIMKTNLDSSALDIEYITKNAFALRAITAKVTYMENCMNENKAYFEKMDPVKKTKLEEKMARYNALGFAINSLCTLHGCDFNSGMVAAHTTKEDREDMEMQYATVLMSYQDVLTDQKAKHEA